MAGSRQRVERVVEAYERSGLTQKAFALRSGVSISTLQSWIYRRRRQSAAAPRLLPVRVAPARTNGVVVEIALSSGVVLRVGVEVEPGYVAALVRALS